MKLNKLFLSMFTAGMFFFLTYAQADEQAKSITITNAWVRLLPPSATTTAAYMTISNSSSSAAVVISAASDVAGATEIHQMSDMNGMMKMSMSGDLTIPASGKTVLQPGGFHMMLINLKKPLHQGDNVAITLNFKDKSSLMVNAVVQAQQPADSSGMDGMKM